MSSPKEVRDQLTARYPNSSEIEILSIIVMAMPEHSMARHDGMMALASLAGRAYPEPRKCECDPKAPNRDHTHCMLCGGTLENVVVQTG